MVNVPELKERVKEFYSFSKQEVYGLVMVIVVLGLVFSFRDWGEDSFDFFFGIKNLVLTIIVVGISTLFRLSWQKIYALAQGYRSEFKVWWPGLIISLVLAFITMGRLPIPFTGTIVNSFMVKQRLGEFRYGYSYEDGAMIGMYGIFGNLVGAVIFAIGLYFLPQSYFFHQALVFNLLMAFVSFLPLPQLDGLQMFFGWKGLYFLLIGLTFLASVLLISRTRIGLIIAIILAVVITTVVLLTTSEK